MIYSLLYLFIVGLLFYAPFYQGAYLHLFYPTLSFLIFLECFLLALVTLDNDEYFGGDKYFYIFAIIAILFNPVIPIPLNKEIWTLVYFIVGIFMLVYFIERKIAHTKLNKINKGK